MNNSELGLKKRQAKFSDEVEKTQYAKINKLNPPNGMPTGFLVANGRQDKYNSHSDEIFDDPKKPAVITLANCDIKHMSFKIFLRKPKH